MQADAYPDSPPEFDEGDFAKLKLPPHSLEAEQSVLGGLMIGIGLAASCWALLLLE